MGAIYATPRVPRDVADRPRLTAVLDSGAPLVIVRGFVGSGKTVVVADWATRLDRDAIRGVWITVDEGSATRLAFWHALLQLMVDAGLIESGSPLQASLASLDSSPDLRRLLLRGFTQLDQDVLLVVDEFDSVVDETIAEDLIALLHAVPHVRVVALTRTRSRLELDPASMTLSPAVIEPRHLMFTREETGALLENAEVNDPDGTVADAIWESVGGLPIATRGLLLILKRQAGTHDAMRRMIGSAAAEVLRNVWMAQFQGDPDIESAIRCSVADVLTLELAEALTQRSDVADVLERIEGMGVGWWSESARGRTFRFTNSIREQLREALERRFPLEIPPLKRITAVWHFEARNSLAALSIAVQLDDFDLADRIVLRDYRKLLALHEKEVIDLVGGVPLRALRKHPLLTMLLALALNASELHRVRAVEMFMLAVAATRMIGARMDPVQRAVLLGIENSALRVTGRTGMSLAAARRTVAHLEGLTLEQQDSLGSAMPTILTHTGLSFYYSGDRDRAASLFQAAYAHPSDSRVEKLHSLSLLAGLRALDGDMPQALELVENGRASAWPDGMREGYGGALFQVAEAMLAIEAGNHARADEHISVMAPHLETIEHWPVLMHVQSLVWLGTGRALEGETVLADALGKADRPSITPYTRVGLDACRALLMMASGQVPAAEKVLARHPKSTAVVALASAHLQLLQERPEAAIRALNVLDIELLSPRHRAELYLARAAASLRVGQADAAVADLGRGLALLENRALCQPFAFLSRADRIALLDEAKTRGRAEDALSAELRAWQSYLPDSVVTVELTEREQVVLRKLVHTANAGTIARELFVSVNTVKSQRRSLYRKLGVSSRDEALRRAGELALF